MGELPERERATAERALRRMVRADARLAVLTGGQTGVDTMAAVASLRAGLPVHMVFPRGFRQEDGRLSMARRAELVGAATYQLASPEFGYRTWTCAYLADAVILVDPAGGEGCRETARAARSLGRPLLALGLYPASPERVRAWLAETETRLLMIAGCRASLLAANAGTAHAQDLVGVIVAAARRRRDELAERALGLAAEQGLGSHRHEACREESPHAGGVARRDLGPDRFPRWYQMSGRPSQQAAESALTATRIDLDGNLPAPGHAQPSDDDTAIGSPGPHVVAVGARPDDPRVSQVEVRSQLDRWAAGQRLSNAQHVDAVRRPAGHPAERC